MSKNILITGASGGFGKLTAQTLLEKGHAVVASMRGVTGKNKAVADELKTAGAKIVEIDVTDDASVNKGVKQAIAMAGGLDVVINNAGVGVLGLQEAYTTEDWKKVFDINVFGVQRINREVLPHMREKNSGLVIFISSLLGRIALPFYGPYQATKWALEAMAENYRVELSGFGVDCVIVEPGGYATTFVDNLVRPSDTTRQESYGPMAQAPQASLDNYENVLKNNPQQNPQNVADTIAELIGTPAGQRKFRNPVDKMGMGDAITEYNSHLEKIMQTVYGNFGIGSMLKVKL
jgi:NAD(P)-dependent dehydrogenase (short-subunit alcohol dehydrogenase family)